MTPGSEGSAPAFDAYGPPDRLNRVAPSLWLVDGPEIGFGYLSLKLPSNAHDRSRA